MRHILFREQQTAKGAKRELLKLRDGWERRLRSPRCDEQTRSILSAWCEQTDSYWPGLFHCYGNPHIPATNNGTEQLIKETKQLERLLSRSPKPAVRFIRHAATNAKVRGWPRLPGKEFLASRSIEQLRDAERQLRERRRQQGVQSRARRDIDGFAQEVLKRWKQSNDPPAPEHPPMPSHSAGS